MKGQTVFLSQVTITNTNFNKFSVSENKNEKLKMVDLYFVRPCQLILNNVEELGKI